ncbi:hypothetical protein DN068_06225 [Taibaiella soli]|uniref:MarR family transcriptional regulator n=1 Tax=Taibaiella soli TaxID=1649169 RepID=A0A2W2C1L3_9BACT|nr:hypothetical protein DN068_06225 [Taibaiella soli]
MGQYVPAGGKLSVSIDSLCRLTETNVDELTDILKTLENERYIDRWITTTLTSENFVLAITDKGRIAATVV